MSYSDNEHQYYRHFYSFNKTLNLHKLKLKIAMIFPNKTFSKEMLWENWQSVSESKDIQPKMKF